MSSNNPDDMDSMIKAKTSVIKRQGQAAVTPNQQ
jgi:hypothetical protein